MSHMEWGGGFNLYPPPHYFDNGMPLFRHILLRSVTNPVKII